MWRRRVWRRRLWWWWLRWWLDGPGPWFQGHQLIGMLSLKFYLLLTTLGWIPKIFGRYYLLCESIFDMAESDSHMKLPTQLDHLGS